ncbi:helix-turn-helix transcriptional regulator [Paenibacillus filicis]|uniref:Helix-turn-helix transcriptional regulator n=1 Tax=Paenibacillus filicis TaxID=669464 RepID=A0ABU9DVM2_9BACL
MKQPFIFIDKNNIKISVDDKFFIKYNQVTVFKERSVAVMKNTKKRNYFSSCRKNKGTLSLVASELGISTVYLRMIENGTFKPGRDLMIRLSHYFDEPLEKLFPDLFENEISV